MRKGYDGLAGLVNNGLQHDPLRGDVFVFISRSRVQIKLLYWDGDGYVLYSKRLERGRFDVPSSTSPALALRRDQLLMLLEGVRLVDTHKKVRYTLA
jgi:transposase